MVQTLTRDRIRDVIETTGNCMVPSTSSRMAGKLVDEVVQCVCQSVHIQCVCSNQCMPQLGVTDTEVLKNSAIRCSATLYYSVCYMRIKVVNSSFHCIILLIHYV